MSTNWLSLNLETLQRLTADKPFPIEGEIGFVSNLQLHDLLLDGFESDDLKPFHFHSELPVSSQFQQLYRFASGQQKSNLRQSVKIAMANWSYPAYRHTTLDELAHLAAYFRITESAPILQAAFNLMRDVPALPTDMEAEFSAQVTIVSVLQGFAPSPLVRDVLLRMLFSPDIDPRLGGHLVRGLISCSPQESDQWLRRYIHITPEKPDPIVLLLLGEDLIELLSLPLFLKMVASSVELQSVFSPVLFEGDNPLVQFHIKDSSSLEILGPSGSRFVTDNREYFALASYQFLATRCEDIVAAAESLYGAGNSKLQELVVDHDPYPKSYGPRPEFSTSFAGEVD